MEWLYFFGGLGAGMGITTLFWMRLTNRFQKPEVKPSAPVTDLNDPDVRALYAEVVRTGRPGRLIKISGFQPVVIETWEAKIRPCPDCSVENGACISHTLEAKKPVAETEKRGSRSSYPPFCGAV
jgi:hypothetical protein